MKRVGVIFCIICILVFSQMAVAAESLDETPAPDTVIFDLSAIGDWLVGLIIPSDEFFEVEFKKFDDKLVSKLPFQTYVDTIGRLKEVSAGLDGNAEVLNIEYEYNGVQHVIDIGSYITPYLPKIRGVVTGLYVILFAYYNYRQLMHLVRGTTYSGIKFTSSD